MQKEIERSRRECLPAPYRTDQLSTGPADLLGNSYLYEARWPESYARQHPASDAQKMVQENADFIDRHTFIILLPRD